MMSARTKQASSKDTEHHRDIQGGPARASVFGISDGLLTNVSLILGVAGANPAPGVVRLAGLAGLLAGAISMGAGEFISVSAQVELLQRELNLEREALKNDPEEEREELVTLYESRGVDRPTAERLVTAVMRDPEVALEVHAREELGVNPHSIGSPWTAAIASFISFAIGALIPLIPWFFGHGTGAVITSIVLGAVTAITIGSALGYFTARSIPLSALRQLGIAAFAAGVTYLIGHIVGVSTH